MQEKKNKRLTLLFLALIAVTVLVYLFAPGENNLDVDRTIFSYKNTSTIDKVVLHQPNEEITLEFDGAFWRVNDKYKADGQRVKVLFAILQQVKVRRPAAAFLQDSLSNEIQNNGTRVTFYESGSPVHELNILGNEINGVTYMQDGETIYLVEIPGYRSYLAGIFTVDSNGWRDPLVFDFNWRNLQEVRMVYQSNNNQGFDVIFDQGAYTIKDMPATDTTKLYNFLDNVSLLFVQDYLYSQEVSNYKEQLIDTVGSIQVYDVGQNVRTLEIYGELSSENSHIVRIDSSQFGLIERNKLREVLRPRRFFSISGNKAVN